MIRIMALVAASAALTACSQTSQTGTTMTTAGYAFAPPAFHSFCAREPRLCSTNGQAKAVTLTPQLRRELESVNIAVNRRVKERSDISSSGKADDWRLPMAQGDCEDFAILKKSELLKRGWPASTLLLTVATLNGQGHTVLTVRTDAGDLVLDNRTNAVKDWSRTSYRYFARQSRNGKWTRIGGPSPVV